MGLPDSAGPRKETGLSDDEIIERVTAGDVDAFEELVRRYREAIFRMVRRRIPKGMAQEIAHEVFVEAYRSLPTFQMGRRFSPWLTAIALRTCYGYWRRAYRDRTTPIGSLSEEPRKWLDYITAGDARQAFEKSEIQREAREILQWSLARLSDEDRLVLELIYLEGRSNKSTARLLGWSTGKVKIRAFRARNKLRRVLTRFLECPREER